MLLTKKCKKLIILKTNCALFFIIGLRQIKNALPRFSQQLFIPILHSKILLLLF